MTLMSELQFLRDIRTMDHELEAERRCIQAELFMNEATRCHNQGYLLPVHQQQAPAQVVNLQTQVIQ